MTGTDAPRARERALTALEREAKYFREQAVLDADVEDVRDLWMSLAEQLDSYVDVQRGRAIAAPLDVPLFEVADA